MKQKPIYKGVQYMNEKILVVDDEKEIADLIEVYLNNENYAVCKFYSSTEALEYIESNAIDLAILDIMMPNINGFSLCQKIREKYRYPIIMLTAKDTESDKITGLTLGADDYVVKPFLPLELVARVKAQLRRYTKYNSTTAQTLPTTILVYGGLELNIGSHEVFINGNKISLTPTEFSILQILLENTGNVVSSEQLFHTIWKDEYYTKNNNPITVHIRHLREKIGDTIEEPKYIKTVWGVGYKI